MASTRHCDSRLPLIAGAALVATAVLAGCSTGNDVSGGASSTTNGASAVVPQPSQPATSTAAPSQDAPTQAPPSQASQGQAQGSDAAEFGLTEAEVTKRVDAVEQSIATCMADAGFEYIPVDYATVRSAMDTNSKPSGMTADEFRAQYGYGIATLSAKANAQANIGLGRNAAIRDGLPPADQVAWIRQLLGENADQTFAVGLDSEDLSRTGGCTKTAVEANFSQAELGPGFINYQNGEGARVDQDPRVIDAYRNWATCMRDAGYSYDDPTSIKLDLASRLATMTGGADIGSLAADAKAAVEQLQGEELAIAAADNQCQIDNVADIKKQVEMEILGRPAA